MEVNITIAPASPPAPSTSNNHTQKHHHLHSQIHSQSHHHGIFSSTSILILVISIIFIILLLAIILIIFLLRRLKSAKNNGNWKKHNSMHNTRSRFIAHTTVNVNSSPGDYLFSKSINSIFLEDVGLLRLCWLIGNVSKFPFSW